MPRELTPDDLTPDEQKLYAAMNKGGRLAKALKMAQQDFESGNFETYESADAYLAAIDESMPSRKKKVAARRLSIAVSEPAKAVPRNSGVRRRH